MCVCVHALCMCFDEFWPCQPSPSPRPAGSLHQPVSSLSSPAFTGNTTLEAKEKQQRWSALHCLILFWDSDPTPPLTSSRAYPLSPVWLLLVYTEQIVKSCFLPLEPRVHWTSGNLRQTDASIHTSKMEIIFHWLTVAPVIGAPSSFFLFLLLVLLLLLLLLFNFIFLAHTGLMVTWTDKELGSPWKLNYCGSYIFPHSLYYLLKASSKSEKYELFEVKSSAILWFLAVLVALGMAVLV